MTRALHIGVLAAALGFILWLTIPASPQRMQCAPAESFIALMKDWGGQVPVSSGLIDENRRLTVLANAEGRFTVLIVTVHGLACLLSAGEGYEPGMLPVDEGDPA